MNLLLIGFDKYTEDFGTIQDGIISELNVFKVQRFLNIGNWNKLKKQLELKYGSEWTEKIQEKKKNVEPKILEFVDYKAIA